jgi:carbohydrate kinase (thermoresistant glucokinase family)
LVYIVMGVAGSGKTAVGMALAARMGLPFYDGDTFHPAANVAKMRSGIPLDDADRAPWLRELAGKVREWNVAGGAVLACSALKERYRAVLGSRGPVRFIYLAPTRARIAERLEGRQGHFMPASLLESQLAALEPPSDAIRIASEGGIEENVAEVLAAIAGQPKEAEKR